MQFYPAAIYAEAKLVFDIAGGIFIAKGRQLISTGWKILIGKVEEDDGGVDTKDIDDAVMRLVNLTEAFIVIKSTVPPDAIDRLSRIDGRIVYEPEFLQESNSKQDMIDARFRVFGVHQQEAAQHLEGLYNYFSLANLYLHWFLEKNGPCLELLLQY